MPETRWADQRARVRQPRGRDARMRSRSTAKPWPASSRVSLSRPSPRKLLPPSSPSRSLMGAADLSTSCCGQCLFWTSKFPCRSRHRLDKSRYPCLSCSTSTVVSAAWADSAEIRFGRADALGGIRHGVWRRPGGGCEPEIRYVEDAATSTSLVDIHVSTDVVPAGCSHLVAPSIGPFCCLLQACLSRGGPCSGHRSREPQTTIFPKWSLAIVFVVSGPALKSFTRLPIEMVLQAHMCKTKSW